MDKEILQIDIINIHDKIIQNFKDEDKTLTDYYDKVAKYEEVLKNENLSIKMRNRIESMNEETCKIIKHLQGKYAYNFYLFDSIPIIDEFKYILDKPVKISFMKNTRDEKDDEKKLELIKNFINILEKYRIDVSDTIILNNNNKFDIKCEICDTDIFEVDGNIYTCVNCGVQIDMVSTISCFKDIDRINISNKYTYDRKTHFKECLNQYQSKPNQVVPPELFEDLYEQIRAHDLVSVNEKNKYSKVSKEHVKMFMKELGYTKYYEEIKYIHHKITGKKNENISHLEDKLLEDFNIITEMYDKIYKNDSGTKRKNFINIHCVLYQLLKRYKYPCKKEDFNVLKTLDRKAIHEDIISNIFYELGWNYSSF
jgi:hypothetical protein